MKTQRHKISAEKKMVILREVLENQVNISEISERYGINPNLIYKWKKQLFEEGLEIFTPKQKRNETKKDSEIRKLKEQLAKKDIAISYLLEDNIKLKKKFGEI